MRRLFVPFKLHLVPRILHTIPPEIVSTYPACCFMCPPFTHVPSQRCRNMDSTLSSIKATVKFVRHILKRRLTGIQYTAIVFVAELRPRLRDTRCRGSATLAKRVLSSTPTTDAHSPCSTTIFHAKSRLILAFALLSSIFHRSIALHPIAPVLHALHSVPLCPTSGTRLSESVFARLTLRNRTKKVKGELDHGHTTFWGLRRPPRPLSAFDQPSARVSSSNPRYARRTTGIDMSPREESPAICLPVTNSWKTSPPNNRK